MLRGQNVTPPPGNPLLCLHKSGRDSLSRISNILVDQDRWTLIDYEWTFGKPMDTAELAFRAVYCYLLENEKRKKLNLDRILESLHITEEDAERYREQEREFQKFVTGDRMAMAEIRYSKQAKTSSPSSASSQRFTSSLPPAYRSVSLPQAAAIPRTCSLDSGFKGYFLHKYFREYVERIGYHSEYPAADFDLIFSNILVDQDSKLQLDPVFPLVCFGDKT